MSFEWRECTEPRDLGHDLKKSCRLQLAPIALTTVTNVVQLLIRFHISKQVLVLRSYFIFSLILWERWWSDKWSCRQIRHIHRAVTNLLTHYSSPWVNILRHQWTMVLPPATLHLPTKLPTRRLLKRWLPIQLSLLRRHTNRLWGPEGSQQPPMHMEITRTKHNLFLLLQRLLRPTLHLMWNMAHRSSLPSSLLATNQSGLVGLSLFC